MATADDGEVIHQTPKDVAERVLALIAIVDKAHNQSPAQLELWVSEHRIDRFFSPEETAFFKNPAPSQQEIVNQSWKAECLVVLFWALGLIEELPPLNTTISWESIEELKTAIEEPTSFVARASLRPKEALNEAEGHLYHQHWRVWDAQLFGKPMPEELNPEIVFMRRYAASWLGRVDISCVKVGRLGSV